MSTAQEAASAPANATFSMETILLATQALEVLPSHDRMRPGRMMLRAESAMYIAQGDDQRGYALEAAFTLDGERAEYLNENRLPVADMKALRGWKGYDSVPAERARMDQLGRRIDGLMSKHYPGASGKSPPRRTSSPCSRTPAKR